MEIIKKYDPKHYATFLAVVNKILNNNNIHEWVKILSSGDIIVWLICVKYCEEENMFHFHEIAILITLVIRLLCIELDVDFVNLKNNDISKLISKFKSILETEIKFRNKELIDVPNYSLLKDL